MTTATIIWLLWQKIFIWDPTLHWIPKYHIHAITLSRAACTEMLHEKLAHTDELISWTCLPQGVAPKDLALSLWQPRRDD